MTKIAEYSINFILTFSLKHEKRLNIEERILISVNFVEHAIRQYQSFFF